MQDCVKLKVSLLFSIDVGKIERNFLKYSTYAKPLLICFGLWCFGGFTLTNDCLNGRAE